jgi:lipopolysaccharide export system ATP-binding protein
MMDTLANPKIETRGLIKEYGKRRVVNKVDVHVNAGEIVGLLGPNGAGKTTTFYMVVGLVSGLATCRKRHRSFVK